MIARRTFIKGASMAAITATTSGLHVGQGHAQQVPNSAGTEPPKLKAPANAADCHMHIYDPARFPMPPNPRPAPTNATVEEYRLLQKRIGTTRVVIVQPRNYATDNRVTLDAIAQLGAERARRRRRHPGDHRRRAQGISRRRHPRHPLQPRGPELACRRARHGRAAGEARRRSRLARAVQRAGRDDRRDGLAAAAPAHADGVRSSRRTRRCRPASIIHRTRSSAS